MAIDSLGSSAAGGARPLDGLDKLESFEDAGFEKLDETARLDLRRALRHLKKSGISIGGSLAELFGRGKTAALTAGHVPRAAPAGRRFESCRHTYPQQNEVSARAAAGSRLGYRAAGIELRGIDGRTYAGTFAKPVKLDGGGYAYRGRIYADLPSIERDLNGAGAGGAGEMPYTVPGALGGDSSLARFLTAGAGASPTSMQLAASIFNRPEGISGGVPADAPIPGGGNATASSILGSGLPMEDQVLLFGANLSSSLDGEIEAKMKQIEAAMGGGTAGNAHGGLAGGTSGTGRGGAGAPGGGSRQSPNLQLLQTQLQQLIQQRTQMFQMMQNILKTLHDTSMAAIRNMKA